ncbi:MAG TPA: Mur ligase family protein [Acidimicrobiales bacterium]|nr:Mur ligase family protein [Acidimicrobiales bacterium]
MTRVLFEVVLAIAMAAGFVAQLLRWLRVLQREHYEPASMRRFLGRWSSPPVASAKSVERAKLKHPITLTHVLLVALAVALAIGMDWLAAVVTVFYGVFCPQGLSIKGRTSQLQWTRRLKTVAGLTILAALIIAGLGLASPRPWLAAVAVVWAVPLLLDLSARALEPYERRQAQKFVDQATVRLERVAPRVIAITGSYGKTSTKNHLADLISEDGGVVASPRSFNNRAGLSRTINENLADGTRVFIAEMGTYGPGEIRALCEWCPPEIAIVTAIGPVHLERMKSMDVIEQAKFEITERANVVIVNVDDSRLAQWPERLAYEGKKVRTAGSRSESASVRVIAHSTQWQILVDGRVLVDMAPLSGVQPTNLACALAAALEVGVEDEQLISRIVRVSAVTNRANVLTASSGVVVIDDTFNANPASAASALQVLSSLDVSGRRVVVTPGLIELGSDQHAENIVLGRKAEAIGAELVVVGRTNAVALQTGFGSPVRRFDTREEAVAWVRSTLVIGDGVLYLNDLPDHYP